MKNMLKEFFKKEKIEYFSVIDFADTRLINPDLLVRKGLTPKSAIVYLVPYFLGYGDNISAYATSRDYHIYVNSLGERLKTAILKAFPNANCVAFGDHSPIDERHAALIGGLGILGSNGLIINQKYGTYVFIGELLTDIEADLLGKTDKREIKKCHNCGACISACPTGILKGQGCECLSFITQKKGELTKEEVGLMKDVNTVWGCDECQKCCPYNKNISLTEIDFFADKRQQKLTKELLDAMSDEEFKQRAYSWRGKKTVERNLEKLGY